MHHLTQSQVKALLRSIPDERDRLAMLVTYLHGLRISEICALTVADVMGGYIRVQRLKGSRKTEHLLIESPDPLLDEKTQLEDVITNHGLQLRDKLFPKNRTTYLRIMWSAGALAGIPPHLCHPHVLKHSIAMHMVKRIDLQELQQYLGHKSLNSTAQYLHVTDAQASQAVQKVLMEES